MRLKNKVKIFACLWMAFCWQNLARAQQISCDKIGFETSGYLSESLDNIPSTEMSWEKYVWRDNGAIIAYPDVNDGDFCDDGNYENINCSPFMFFDGGEGNVFSVDPKVNVNLGDNNNLNSYVRLGNPDPSITREQLKYSFEVTAENYTLMYRYFVVFNVPIENGPEGVKDQLHEQHELPFFNAYVLNESGQKINNSCFGVAHLGKEDLPDEYDYKEEKINPQGNYDFDRRYAYSKEWNTRFINLSSFIGQTVTLVFETGDCAKADHFGYAYVDAQCVPLFNFEPPMCLYEYVYLNSKLSDLVSNISNEEWDTPYGEYINDGNSEKALYTSVGQKNVGYNASYTLNNGTLCHTVINHQINIEECEVLESNCCVNTFSPEQGKQYLVSAWCSETSDVPVNSYDNAGIEISYTVGEITLNETIRTTGKIIEEWQKIEGSIVIPGRAETIKITLLNNGENDVYYDDIRFQPYNSALQTFIYDPVSKKLVAQHDQNNYATFFEYDEEGNLLRIKKETERGMSTISESRQNLIKK
jgi:hypothetical protein